MKVFSLTIVICTMALCSWVDCCTDFEFECDNGQCIRNNYRCDLEPDCDDGSDESGCEDISCTDDFFRCNTGRCIPKAFKCDEESDCDDGSDEKECDYKRPVTRNITTPRQQGGFQGVCEHWQFQCTSGSCIRGTYQCDDDKDCTDGSDEVGCEPCVSTSKLEVGKPPFCKVRFYQGTSRVRNESNCLHDDIFLVKTGRLIPHDRRSFIESRVNYVRMSCESYHPVNFEFDGVGYIEQVRVLRTQKTITDGLGTVVYSTDVTTVATPLATGNYVFTELNPNTTQPKSTTLFFYFEKERKPFLLGTDRIQKAKRIENFVILPCVAAKYNLTLHLFKQSNEGWNQLDSSKYTYNMTRGFRMQASDVDSTTYKCTTDSSLTSDLDTVTVNVDPVLSPNDTKESNLKIVVGKGLTATCHSVGPLNGTKLEFTNIYADNPIDAKILTDCILKGSHTCGSYALVRNHHPISDDIKCRNEGRKTQCKHISEIYTQGVFICQSDSESVVQQYFSGLDDVIYKDWRSAPKSALIRLESLSNVTTGISGNSLSTKCLGVSMVFGRSAITFESKSNGSDVVTKHSSGGYHTWSFTLRENMTQLSCSDSIWKTNDRIWSEPINVTVTPKIVVCGILEMKCASGQCVRASYRCDGDRDCLDGTDEQNCPTTTTTTTQAPATCSYLQFSCYRNIRFEKCIPAAYRCDGDSDCENGEDEENCPSSTTSTTTTTTLSPNGCRADQFECVNGDCIRASYKCDLAKDCKDGTDEYPYVDCGNMTTPAPSTTTTLPTTPEPVAAVTTSEGYMDELADERIETSDQASSSTGTTVGIVIGVLLCLALLSIVCYFVYTRYYQRQPGVSTASNIKYTNPTCDQEEVLIG